MDEAKLLEKLRLLEALHARAATEGERAAAAAAIERILLRLQANGWSGTTVTTRSTRAQAWSRKLFITLCRHYGVDPARFEEQWRTVVVERVSRKIEIWTKRGGSNTGR